MYKPERFNVGFQSSGSPQTQEGLLVCDNVDFQQSRTARMRDGDEAVPMSILDSSSSVTGRAVWHRGKELDVVGDDGGLYTFNRCEAEWQRAGDWTPARLRQMPVLSNTQSFRQVDAQTLDGCTLIVGESGTVIEYAVVGDDGQVLVSPTQLAAVGWQVRCAKADDWILIVWTDGHPSLPGNDVIVAVWRPTDVNTVTIVTTLVGAVHNNPVQVPLYDVRQRPGTNLVTFVSAPSVITIFGVDLDDAGAGTGSSIYAVGGSAVQGVSVWPLAGVNRRIAWWDSVDQTVNSILGDDISGILEQASAAAVLDDGTTFEIDWGIAVATSPGVGQPTRAVVVSTSRYTSAGITRMFKMDTWETYGAVMTQLRFRWHTTLESMAWIQDGEVLVATTYDASGFGPWEVNLQLFNYVWGVQNVATGEIVSRAMRGYQTSAVQLLQNPVTPDVVGDVVTLVAVRTQTEDGNAPSFDIFTYLLEHDFSPRAQQPAVLNGVAHAAHAGYVRSFDGQTASEHDWHVLPDSQSATTTPGTFNVGVTYSYALTWEWRNRSGQMHRSAPLVSNFITGPAGEGINLVVRTLGWTNREDVRLVGWRTLENDASVMHREISVANDPLVRTITIQFVLPDLTISTQELFDQQPVGSTLPHDPTPATDFVAVAQGRLWTRDPERGDLVRFGLPSNPPFALGWTSLQGLELGGQESCTAVAEQDGQIMLFTADGAYVTAGSGPESNGGGQGFATPQRVPLDTGAAHQEGVVRLATGIAYGSPSQGPRVMARTRSGVDLASLVERLYEHEGQTVVAAVWDPNTGEMYALDNGAEGGVRGTLRLHLGSGRWSRDTGRQGLDLSLGSQGELIILRLDGTLIRRVAGRVLDAGNAAQTMTVQTPWSRVAEETIHPVQDVLLAQVTGTYLGPHRLDGRLYRDYLATPTIDAGKDIATAPNDYVQRIRWGASNTGVRATSVAWTVTANGSQGVELVVIGIELKPTGATGPMPRGQDEFLINP